MHPWSELREPLGDDHARRRFDQREMGERLREVPQVPQDDLWLQVDQLFRKPLYPVDLAASDQKIVPIF
jgi:hypothetical protein